MMKSVLRSFALLIALGLCLTAPAFAAGPLFNCNSGQPFLWPAGGTNIPWNPDQGALGPLTNAQAVQLVNDSFAQWGAIPSATTTYLQGAAIPVDVDETNFIPFAFPVAPDGLSAIVFDEDGAIFDILFGPGSGVLGFASPEWANTLTCEILEGVAFINGGALSNLSEAFDIIVHEFGHYQNLAHTVVNGQVVLGDHSGPTPNDTFPVGSLVNQIETMYPFYFGTAAGTFTPDKDDVASLSQLYPSATFASTTATVTGRILGPNGTTQLTGVNVIARNVANPFGDAVSAISSDFAVDYTQGQPFVGVYTLRNLTPGASYAIFVDEILAGGFSTPPLFPLPGPEEFYNGALESTNGATDIPTAFTGVSAAAGGTASNINILFNAPAPNTPLPVGDDGSVELFLPFTFEICGQKFDSVHVNANGNVTFGAPDGSFTETIEGFLFGPPRIAGLWDDLNPGAGGSVVFQQTSTTFTIKWTNVPEFIATGSNSFLIRLNKLLNLVELDWDGLTAADGISGVSCGGAITSGFERPTNLSAIFLPLDLLLQGASFEVFGPGNPVDVANDQVLFLSLARFRDRLESNNTIATARKIELPFDSVDLSKYTEIKPLGNDVDYFKFKVKANDILAIETVTGANVDTVLGLFDASNGALLLADDDGGDGLLSRLLVQVPVDIELAVAVSTFPDFDFNGDGGDTGRYVLSVRKYKGTLVAAGDDTATPFNLGFTFPYQGSNHTSTFVNSNGNLTFGAGSTDFSETVAEFLAGPPRIAPRWDDLDAGDGVIVATPSSDHGEDAVTFHFISVPEFFTTRANYFSVKLEEDGDIDFDFAATSRTDGITGITQGGGAADPGETNLSADPSQDADGTTYEFFSAADVLSFDLFFRSVEFDD